MSKLPLTRCQFVLPFAQMLDTLGAPTQYLLERHTLPVNLRGCIDDYVPIRNALRFAEAAKRTQRIPDLGFVVTRRASLYYLSRQIRTLLANSATLFSALRILCAYAHLETTNLRMSLTFHGNSVRLRSQLNGLTGQPHLEHSQWFQNVLSIHVVREFVGPDWAPATMAFEARYFPGPDAREHWPRTRFLSGQECSWIDIPSKYLCRPPISAWKYGVAAEEEHAGVSGRLADTLQLMLPAYLGGRIPTVMDIAEMANTSTRNLQRLLAASGSSYRGILNTVRLQRATDLLKSPDIKIIDIALFLGYTDAAHFTRAFRKMAGLSPLQFRRSQLKASPASRQPLENSQNQGTP